MVEIVFTDEFGERFGSLSEDEQGDIFDVVRKLEAKGVALGFPHCSAVTGRKRAPSRIAAATGPQSLAADLCLRPASGRGADHRREQGCNPQFYRRLGPVAERIWREYLAEQIAGQHEDEE
jgi:hypothetical protein